MQRMAECWQVKKMNQKNKTKKNPAAAGCNALGIFLLIALVAVCLPLTLPKAFGYHIYTVVSGSMEPAIMTGSLVYIKEEAPEDMQQDDIIAFYGTKDGASIITHRVVENRVLMGEFITKGDANKTQDMNPVRQQCRFFLTKAVLKHIIGVSQNEIERLWFHFAASPFLFVIILLRLHVPGNGSCSLWAYRS